MKVVHLLPALEQGGVENVVCSLNRMLSRRGHESVVVSRGGRLVPTIVSEGGRHVEMDLKSKNPMTFFFRALRLRSFLESECPDLVCVHSRVPAWLFVFASRTLSVKWISYAHGANSVSGYSSVMTRGDAVVVPSRFLARFLTGNYPSRPGLTSLSSRIEVVHPCVDLERFDPEAVDPKVVSALRAEWGIGRYTYVTMSVGRITPLKGLDGLIRDFASTSPDAGTDRRLVIVGGVDKRHRNCIASLKRLAVDLGVAERVVFAGSRDAVPECLSIADEVVSSNTSKPESFGLSVVEALAMNRKVRLMRRFGGAAEILDDVASVPTDVPRDAVRRLYSPETFAEKTLSVYRRVCRCD